MNRKQRLILGVGVLVGAVALAFPPWRCGRVSLPYRPHWPPPSAPMFSMTAYPPLSFMIEAPEWDAATTQAVSAELQAAIVQEQARGKGQDGNDILLRGMRRAFQIDLTRLAGALAVIVGGTTAGIWLCRERRSPGPEERAAT